MHEPDIAAAYDRWAPAYDADDNRTRDLDARIVRAFVHGRRFGTIVEAGCGTGKNTPTLAACADLLVGLDFSAGMLAAARQRGLPAHVSLQQHDIARPWPIAPGCAELVTFSLVLEHLQPLDAAFAHAARACAPDAEVLVTELHPLRQHAGARARFEDAGGAAASIAAFPHHVSDYLRAADAAGLALLDLDEHWSANDPRERPRILALRFRRGRASG